MCVPNSPLFQRCQVYDWPPFFNKKYMNGPIFLDFFVKGPIFLTSWYMHIFFAQIFFEAAYPLGITWIDCDICVTTSKKWIQKIKGQYMNRSTFWMIKYMNGSVFSKARYMNGVGFEILARTPVPKLPLSYPPPPAPERPPPPGVRWVGGEGGRAAKIRGRVWGGVLPKHGGEICHMYTSNKIPTKITNEMHVP